MLLLLSLLACEDPAPTAIPSSSPAATPSGPPPSSLPAASPSGPAPDNGAPVTNSEPPPKINPPSAAECQVVTSNASVPKSMSELTTLKEKGGSWTEDQARSSYLCAIAAIAQSDADAKKAGKSAEERAKAAFVIRHDARALAREMLGDPAKISTLKAADQQKFGHDDGPDFDHMLKKGQEKGLAGDKLYEDVLQVIMTKPDLDKALGL